MKADSKTSDRLTELELRELSHDLLTPLNHIVGFSENLKMDTLSEEQRELVGKLLEAGLELTATIHSQVLNRERPRK